jgi:hypothetical protein
MAEPLDYFNPNSPERRDPVRRDAPLPPVAVPAEFDVLLTRTHDVAAGRAVEAALRRARIDVFAADRGEGVALELYVREPDQPWAAQVAASVFARRRKLKSIPMPMEPPIIPRSDE